MIKVISFTYESASELRHAVVYSELLDYDIQRVNSPWDLKWFSDW